MTVELRLRRTWYEVAEHLGSVPRPLRLAKIINRISPRSWSFRASFDSAGRIALEIDCDPAATDDETFALLDGSVEEVFLSDRILVQHGGRSLVADTAKLLTDPPSSNVLTLEDSGSSSGSLLVLEGFSRSTVVPRELQEGRAVKSYFLEHTWMGSPDFTGSRHSARWVMFGASEALRPASRYAAKIGGGHSLALAAQLYGPTGEHIGDARLLTSESLKSSETYTTFGPIPVDLSVRSPISRSDHQWIIELGGYPLTRAVLSGSPTGGLTRALVESLDSALSSLASSTELQSYTREVKRAREAEAADRLRRRQERAQKADRVFVAGVPVMLVPSCENEVLALLCKLEALGAIPFHEFRLWEYTSRVGIDALASYRIRDVDVPYQHAAVEVEHHFENFFDHAHPHQQVNLVICWDFRNGEAPANLRRRRPWLFEYRNDDSFSILVLSKVPDLNVEGGGR